MTNWGGAVAEPELRPLTLTRVNVSMVSLKWGDVLSTMLPGALALYGVARWFPWLSKQLTDLDNIGWGNALALGVMAALAGGILEAVTRISWERWCLIKICSAPKNVLEQLTPETLELYERGVQSSYKYVTFYANFAWAVVLLIAARVGQPFFWTFGTALMALTVAILLYASCVQWKYFVNYQTKVFSPKVRTDDGKRSTGRDKVDVSQRRN